MKVLAAEPIPSPYNTVMAGVLVALLLVGLAFGLIYTLNFGLNSDTVVPGLVAMEIFQHGNFQYFFPSSDPYLFTDTYTFYLIPQFLSGYSPTVICLTAFAIFLLVIAVYSYIVYKYAGKFNALLFAALLASVGPVAYTQFITPVNHVGTILFTGVLILLFEFDRYSKAGLPYKLACIFLACLMVVSDSFLLVTFIAPYLLTYVLYFRKKYQKLDRDLGILVAAAGASLVIKYDFIPSFWGMPPNPMDAHTIATSYLPILASGLLTVFDSYLADLTLWGIVGGVVVLALIIISLYYALRNLDKKALYLYSIFGFSFAFALVALAFTGLAGDSSVRFLTFALVSFLVVIALAFRYTEKNRKACLTYFLLVVVLAASALPLNVLKTINIDHNPNAREYGMLDYMQSNHIALAMSGYWNANILTYLSKENTMVLTVKTTDIVQTNPWLGTWRWWEGKKEADMSYVILDGDDTSFNESLPVFDGLIPVNTLHYENYTIYQIDNNDSDNGSALYLR